MRQRAGGCILTLLSTLLLSGCAADQAELAARGKHQLTGLTPTEMRMCAGHPASIAPVERGEVWVYEHGATQSGISLVSPVLYGVQLNQPGGGYCRVQLRFVDRRVAEVVYAGATDAWGARDAVCAPIIRTCLERAEQRLVSTGQ